MHEAYVYVYSLHYTHSVDNNSMNTVALDIVSAMVIINFTTIILDLVMKD